MAKDTIFVSDGDQSVPFLRGVITHWLVSKGLSFQDAYAAAREVRGAIRSGETISRGDLSKLIRKTVERLYGNTYDLSTPDALTTPLIQVDDGRTRLPFSKGVLSRSLQATGMEPAIGFQIAHEIEAILVQEGRRKIDSADIRGLVYKALLKARDRHGAERYLLWRLFKPDSSHQSASSMDRPLVILFGGATGTGKSSMAAEVAHRLGIRQVLSTDTVRQIMRMMISRDLLPAVHSSSFSAWQDFGHDLEDEAVLRAFREQATRVLVGVKAILERAATEKVSMILEGIHLVPGLLPLEEFKDRIYIVPVVVSTLKKKIHAQRFPERERRSGRSAEDYQKHFAEIRLIQDDILEAAENHDIPILDNIYFEQTVTESLSVIAESLREELGISRKALVERALAGSEQGKQA